MWYEKLQTEGPQFDIHLKSFDQITPYEPINLTGRFINPPMIRKMQRYLYSKLTQHGTLPANEQVKGLCQAQAHTQNGLTIIHQILRHALPNLGSHDSGACTLWEETPCIFRLLTKFSTWMTIEKTLGRTYTERERVSFYL